MGKQDDDMARSMPEVPSGPGTPSTPGGQSAPRDTQDTMTENVGQREPLVSVPSTPLLTSADEFSGPVEPLGTVEADEPGGAMAMEPGEAGIPDEVDDDPLEAPTIVNRRSFPRPRGVTPREGSIATDATPTPIGPRPPSGAYPDNYAGPPRVQRSSWQSALPRPPAGPRVGSGIRAARSAPRIVPFASSTSWGPTTFVITANTAAGFSYLFWWVSGLIVYFNERRNRYVRFHAVQSILLMGTLSIFAVLAYIVAALFNDLFVNTQQRIWETLSHGTIILAVLIVVLPWLTAMLAAWSGTYLRLPIVGEYAERYAVPAVEPKPGSHA